MTTSSIENTTPGRSRGALAWLIISQLLGLFSLIPWVAFAGLSFMAFDSGESTQAWIFVGVIWSWPLVPVVSGILAWMLYARRKTRAAVIVTSLPILVAVIVLILGTIFMSWF